MQLHCCLPHLRGDVVRHHWLATDPHRLSRDTGAALRAKLDFLLLTTFNANLRLSAIASHGTQGRSGCAADQDTTMSRQMPAKLSDG